MTKSYYKVINGKRYDREMLEIASDEERSQEDGKINKVGAENLFNALADGDRYTDTEKATLAYIRKHYDFTEEADQWLRTKIHQWSASHRVMKKQVEKGEEEGEKKGSEFEETQIIKESQAEEKKIQDTETAPKESELERGEKVREEPSVEPRKGNGVLYAAIVVLAILVMVAFFLGRTTTESEITEIDAAHLRQERDQALLKAEEQQGEIDRLRAQLESNVSAKRAERDQKEEEPLKNAQKIRNKIFRALQKEFQNDFSRWNANLDKTSLTFRFMKSETLFPTGQANLNSSFQQILSEFFPRYVQILSQYQDQIKAVNIGGHASSEWKHAQNDMDAFLKNMKLSFLRSFSTLSYCMNLKEIANTDWLKRKIATNGYSSSRTILGENQREEQMRSRRIEFVLVLDE